MINIGCSPISLQCWAEKFQGSRTGTDSAVEGLRYCQKINFFRLQLVNLLSNIDFFTELA